VFNHRAHPPLSLQELRGLPKRPLSLLVHPHHETVRQSPKIRSSDLWSGLRKVLKCRPHMIYTLRSLFLVGNLTTLQGFFIEGHRRTTRSNVSDIPTLSRNPHTPSFGDHRCVCQILSTPKASGGATAVRSGRGGSRALESKVRFVHHPETSQGKCTCRLIYMSATASSMGRVKPDMPASHRVPEDTESRTAGQLPVKSGTQVGDDSALV
jgi:hypothetical protein